MEPNELTVLVKNSSTIIPYYREERGNRLKITAWGPKNQSFRNKLYLILLNNEFVLDITEMKNRAKT